jgi:hypothetical protein
LSKKHNANPKLLYLVEQFKKSHPEADHVELDDVAKWAIAQGLWVRPPTPPEVTLRKELSRAMRNEYVIDPQGREVRKNHVVFTEEKTPQGIKRRAKWYTNQTAPPEPMRISLQIRRRSSLSDVLQIVLDFDSYNDNNPFNAKLPAMDFNYNKDIEEMSLPSEYEESSEDAA